MENCACSSELASKSRTCMSGRPAVVSTSVMFAQPFDTVGRIAPEGTQIVSIPGLLEIGSFSCFIKLAVDGTVPK